ncbi:MAG: hypothetical protein F4Y02_01925, partial [Chloroflexi bacterium]|nr:hypothetical protein [Chloroflexota bacterium]
MISPSSRALDEVIRGYVAMGSGLDVDTDVLPGNPKGPTPQGLYATVLFVDDATPGTPYRRWTDVEGALTAQTLRDTSARYSVQWMRTGARDAARRFVAWLSSSAGHDEAIRQHLVVQRVSAIRRLDTLIADDWEERVNVDLQIGYVEALCQRADAIASAGITLH